MENLKKKALNILTLLAFINMFFMVIFQDLIFGISHSFVMMVAYIIIFMICLSMVAIYLESVCFTDKTEIIGSTEKKSAQK